MIPLRPQDYEFSACPGEELQRCYQYEYFREHNELRNAVPQFRKHNQITSFEKSLSWYAKNFHGRKPLFWTTHFPEWPEIPYLCIKASERKRRFKELKDERFRNLEPIDYIRPTLLLDLWSRMRDVSPGERASAMGEWLIKALAKGRKDSDWPQIRSEEKTDVLFEIRWGMTDTQIIEAFRQWLHKHQPEWRRKRKKVISPNRCSCQQSFAPDHPKRSRFSPAASTSRTRSIKNPR